MAINVWCHPPRHQQGRRTWHRHSLVDFRLGWHLTTFRSVIKFQILRSFVIFRLGYKIVNLWLISSSHMTFIGRSSFWSRVSTNLAPENQSAPTKSVTASVYCRSSPWLAWPFLPSSISRLLELENIKNMCVSKRTFRDLQFDWLYSSLAWIF